MRCTSRKREATCMRVVRSGARTRPVIVVVSWSSKSHLYGVKREKKRYVKWEIDDNTYQLDCARLPIQRASVQSSCIPRDHHTPSRSPVPVALR